MHATWPFTASDLTEHAVKYLRSECISFFQCGLKGEVLVTEQRRRAGHKGQALDEAVGRSSQKGRVHV